MRMPECGLAGAEMRRVLVALLVCGAALAGRAGGARAQSRADSAAVLLDAAEQLRMRGETGAARALLALIAERFADTPAALEVDRLRAVLRRTPDRERSGRTELLVFGTGYGAWLGVALPLMAESERAEAYGLGLLVGAPLGFFTAKAYADRKLPTEGQTRAITFGGTWGTYMGIATMAVLDLGQDTRTDCLPEIGCQDIETDPDVTTVVGMALGGGLAGIGVGALLARKPITAGTAAATTLAALWGTWFGFAVSYIAGLDGDNLLAGTMVGGNTALVGVGLLAPRWQMSESRARLISLGGLMGGLGGAGLLLLIQPDDEKVAVAIPMVTSAVGLYLGARTTRNRDIGPEPAGGRGALLNGSRGRWTLDTPHAALRMTRDAQGSLRPAAYVPLVSARF